MKKLFTLMLVLGLSFGLSACTKDEAQDTSKEQTTSVETQNETALDNEAVLLDEDTDSEEMTVEVTFDFGPDRVERYEDVYSAGETAYDSVVDVADANGYVLDIQEYDFGTLINGIDGVLGDNDTATYWSFYIGQDMASVGADTYEIQQGNTIMMKYQSL